MQKQKKIMIADAQRYTPNKISILNAKRSADANPCFTYK